MADKAISELVAAEQIKSTDMFVLEQDGTAKRLQGQTLLNWLTAAADGHGGIKSIAKTGTSGLVDTYTITLADTTTMTFTVTNGNGLTAFEKTGTVGLVDTYRFSRSDGTYFTFAVANGAKGDTGDASHVWIKYASQQPTAASHSMGDEPDDWMGVYSGTAESAPDNWQDYTWYQIKGEKGDTGAPATVTGTAVEYMVSDSGTVAPTGSWSATIPTVPQGKYLWTRVTTTFNTGSPVVSYSVTRMGIDGTGSVSTVNNQSPDENGNVAITAADIQTDGNKSVQAALDAKADTDDIPAALSELTEDDTHRLVTDTEKTTWNDKQSKITTNGILKGDGNGGVSKATSNVDYAPPSVSAAATLTAAGWSDGVQSLAVSGITATSNGSLRIAQSATDEQFAAWGAAQPRVTAQAAGSLTVKAAGAVPVVDIPVEVIIV